jgi:ABC-2 type transport system permease protein
VSKAAAIQTAYLARRSVLRLLRQPGAIVPSILFPLMLMAVNTGGLASETRLPGFPTDSFLDFALAVPFVQGALFVTMNAGTELARDIENGFLNRLQLTPMAAPALVIGHLAGAAAFGILQAGVYLAVGLAAGAGLEAGLLGGAVLVLLASTIAISFATVGIWLALRSGSGEAVQGMFPFVFVFLFISSMNIPRNLIEIDWFRFAATYNPVSYLIEGTRSLIIAGWDGQALALGFGCALALMTVSLVLASLSLRTRLTRT